MKNNGLNIFNIDENGVITGLCERVNIPEGVEKIATDFHNGCLCGYDFITEINIPSTCECISGEWVFMCKNLTDINVAKENQQFVSEGGVLYTADKSRLVRYPSRKECDVFHLPCEVEEIGSFAFADAKNISGIYIGKNCRSIGENAFSNTTGYLPSNNYPFPITYDRYLGIRKYYISPSVTDIAKQIFEGSYEEFGMFYEDIIVGGEVGSAIWEHCNRCNIKFLDVREEAAEEFLSAPYEKLVERHKIVSESPISFEFTDECFGGRLVGDTLELFALDGAGAGVTVCQLDAKLPQNRYEKVKKLVIGDGICAIDRQAFWRFYELESVYFGADISNIQASAFYEDGRILTLAVDERNEHYKCIDGVIFSPDLKTLVMYPSGRPDPYYEIPSHVETVGTQCMLGSSLRCIKFGSNVKRISDMACYNTFGQHHFYVDPSVTEFDDDFIFGVDGKMGMCICMWNLVVGGKAGSPIEKYCREIGRNGITFEVVEDDRLDEWLAPPPDEKKNRTDDDLPF